MNKYIHMHLKEKESDRKKHELYGRNAYGEAYLGINIARGTSSY